VEVGERFSRFLYFPGEDHAIPIKYEAWWVAGMLKIKDA
jgi:hypothetical protein